jgi:glycyl-tRNA synthetase beta chain
VAGFFERGFLALPHEVLTTTLVHHQHYFPVMSETGELKEAFLAVVNTQPQDERLIAKNAERVVTARLRDAKFFWDADRKIKLEDRLDRLHTIVFHKKLGSYRDKAERIEKLARTIAADVFGVGAEQAEHAGVAARLAKTDLVTDMVFEFPELQGQMGGVYAREEGQPEQVWKAIYHQYLPVGVEAEAPPNVGQLGGAAIPWAAVSLADKLDTVVGLFAVGEKPTGSRDPFGVRRAAQGIVKILADLPQLGLSGPLQVNLPDLLDAAYAQLPDSLRTTRDGWRALGFSAFFAEREAHLFERRGFKAGEIRSVTSHVDDPEYPQYWQHPHLAMSRIKAVAELGSSTEFKALAGLLKRASNISKGVRFDIGWEALAEYAKQSDVPVAERHLIGFVGPRAQVLHEARLNADYAGAARQIAQLQPYVAKYFDDVMVMTEDLQVRRVRLQLMAGVRDLVLNLADISEIASDDAKQA